MAQTESEDTRDPGRIEYASAAARRVNRAVPYRPQTSDELDAMWAALREQEVDSQIQLIRRAVMAPLSEAAE
jgi:hypothetical protein